MHQRIVQCAGKALLFLGQGAFNVFRLGDEFRVRFAHVLNVGSCDMRHEWLAKTHVTAEPRRPPNDHPQNVFRAVVARPYPIRNHKRGRPHMVGNDPIADVVRLALFVAVAQQLLHHVHGGGEQIGVVVIRKPLLNLGDALQTHARINRRAGQGGEGTISRFFILHEDEVPNLEVIILDIDPFRFHIAHIAQVIMYFGAGAAGADIAHLPEVFFFAKAQNPLRGDVRLP